MAEGTPCAGGGSCVAGQCKGISVWISVQPGQIELGGVAKVECVAIGAGAPHKLTLLVKKDGKQLASWTHDSVVDVDGDAHATFNFQPLPLSWAGVLELQCRDDTVASKTLSDEFSFDALLPLSVSPNPAGVGQQVKMECYLTPAGAGHTVAFFIKKPGVVDPIASAQKTAAGDGKAIWQYPAQANWPPKVEVHCRDEDPSVNKPVSDFKALSVN